MDSSRHKAMRKQGGAVVGVELSVVGSTDSHAVSGPWSKTLKPCHEPEISPLVGVCVDGGFMTRLLLPSHVNEYEHEHSNEHRMMHS